MELALVVALASLLLIAAALTVLLEDRRAARRDARQRQARLARLGEADPLAPARLQARLEQQPRR